jgi:hypothetical protein
MKIINFFKFLSFRFMQMVCYFYLMLYQKSNTEIKNGSSSCKNENIILFRKEIIVYFHRDIKLSVIINIYNRIMTYFISYR